MTRMGSDAEAALKSAIAELQDARRTLGSVSRYTPFNMWHHGEHKRAVVAVSKAAGIVARAARAAGDDEMATAARDYAYSIRRGNSDYEAKEALNAGIARHVDASPIREHRTARRSLLREFGIPTYDGRSGGGYGNLPGSGRFDPRQSAEAYPYGSESDLACGDEDEEDDEAIEKRQAYGAVDALQQRNNAMDRDSFVGNASRLYMSLVPDGDPLFEDIYTPDARSGPNVPKLAATTRGWSGAPRGTVDDENEAEPMSLLDVFDDVDDPDYQARRQRRLSCKALSRA